MRASDVLQQQETWGRFKRLPFLKFFSSNFSPNRALFVHKKVAFVCYSMFRNKFLSERTKLCL